MTTSSVTRLAAGIAFDFLRILTLRPACAYCPKQAETTTRLRRNIPATKSIPVCAGCCDDYDGGIAGKRTYAPATVRQIRAYAHSLRRSDRTLTAAGALALARDHEAQRAAAHAHRHTDTENLMSDKNLWDMQDDFDNATTDAEREEIREEIRSAGYNGVADTIGKD